MEANDGYALPKKTVDEIFTGYPEFRNFNFLKLDTDGNDFDILKGKYLKFHSLVALWD